MKPQSDSTMPRRLAIKKGREGCRTRSVFTVTELQEFSWDSPSSRLCPDCGLPSHGGVAHGHRVGLDGSGGALVNISRAPPLASRKLGLVMEMDVPSSRLEVRGGLAMELGASVVLSSWWVWPRCDCPGRLPRWCDVQSLEWKTLSSQGAAIQLSSWSSAVEYKPDLSSSSEGDILLGMVRNSPRYGQGNKTRWTAQP
jgi:hypothetical protein